DSSYVFCIIPTSAFLLILIRRAVGSVLFPYTTLFRSRPHAAVGALAVDLDGAHGAGYLVDGAGQRCDLLRQAQAQLRRISGSDRSEEHTSELQSRFDLVCRLLLEKKKIYSKSHK